MSKSRKHTKRKNNWILNSAGSRARRNIFITLASVVVFVTTYALILPAITASTNTYCGKEEHTHSDECYETTEVLTCTQEESEGHVHTDSCYTTEKTLTCGQEESNGHVHTAECYNEAGELICGMTEGEGAHYHTDACYTEEKILTCGMEEGEGAHQHTDACYTEEKTLVCGKEEHTHTDSCYADTSADLETAANWENTMKNVKLTGNWSEDILSIADSQLGYTESTRNYIINDKGKKKGYSRYGAWYGDPYGDWCAMFASFCIRYSDISSTYMPVSGGCQNWIATLNTKEFPYYYAVNDKNSYSLVNGADSVCWNDPSTEDGCTLYHPKAGDLIFFNWDDEYDADHVGIIESLEYNKSGQLVSIHTIEGNCSNAVKEKTYSASNTDIMGFAALPQNPNYIEDEKEAVPTDVEPDEDTEIAEVTETTETTEETEETETTEEIEEAVAEEIAQETETTETADFEEESSARLIYRTLPVAIYTDSYYTELSDDQTTITVTGNLPENAYVQAYPAYVDKSDFEDGITVLRAYDITIFNEDGSTFEPADGNSISVNIEIPGLENMADTDTVSVYYVPVEGEPEEMQAETADEAVSFDAEHFSTYAVTADTTNNTVTINGVTYTKLANYTETVSTENNDKVVMLNTGTFSYKLDFTLDNTKTTDRYYVQLPANAVLQEVNNEPIKDASGNTLAYYTVNNTTDENGDPISYILITPAEASTQMTGSVSASGTATKEGQIIFSQGGYIYVIPSDSNYNSLTTSKTETGHTRNEDGSYTIYFNIVIQNTGNTDIKNLWFMDAARLNMGSYTLTYTTPVSTDAGAPQFQTEAESGYTGTETSTAGYNYYFIGTPDNPVTIPANTTYTYTSSATMSAEEFAKMEAADAQTGTSNALRVYYNDTKLRENYAWVNYYPASIILSKKALTANVNDASEVIPWQISYNENSRFNTSDVVITDTIQELAYDSGNGIHYLTDYPVTATIMRYGYSQSTIQLTWVEVDDLDNIENPDSEHIYYCGNSFKYYPSTYTGWSSNYGVVLQYYTNYDKEISATANEAQANFVDTKGAIGEAGTVIGVDTKGTSDSRIQINKMLNSQGDDNTAEWTVVSSINSTSTLTGNFYDNLPCDNDPTGAKLVSSTEKLINDQKIYANSQVDSDSAYIVFDSVAQFEEVTGIKITVTDRATGAVLDKEAILCGGAVSYTDKWNHTYDETDMKKLLFFYDTKSNKVSNTASFMIVPNVPASIAETNLEELKYAINRQDGTGFLPSNEQAGTTSGYNITFTYTTDTSNAVAGETRRNYITHSGSVSETGDNFNLKANAYYVKSSDDTIKNIDKQLAKVTLQDDGSYRLTYVTLLDNRNLKTTSQAFNTLYWDDVLSGVDGAEYVQGSLDVYIANAYLNDDKTEYLIDTYSSLDTLESADLIKIINDGQFYTYSLEEASASGKLQSFVSDNKNYVTANVDKLVSGVGFGDGGLFDLTDVISVGENSSGFRFSMNTRKVLSSYNNTPQIDLLRCYQGNAVNCWQSFYLVYDVVVPADKMNSGVLRNTVTRYMDGNADVSSYNEFSMLMKELQKKETQKADSTNSYTTKYELDVTVDEKLQALNSFTVQDVMSDNLNMDISSMVVTYTKADGTTGTLTSSDFTARFANNSLTLILNKPDSGWPSNYTITYSAKLTGDGPTSYENSAWIPEVGSTPQSIESSTYITDDEIGDKQVSISIQKYDGNNLGGGGIDGATFKLERLTNEAQQELLKQKITSKSAMDDYLSSLPDSSWTSINVPQPQAVSGTTGEFTLTSSTESAIYSNVVYRLKETTPPTDYVLEDVHRYFMIYSATADATQTGVTAAQAYAYIYPYVDQESYYISYQIPNYKVNFNVYKTDQNGEDLTGAEFTLYSNQNCSDSSYVQKAIPTVDEDGRTCYNFKDLGAGTYYVKETKAPTGYDLSEETVKVTIAEDGTITFADSLTKENDSTFSMDTVNVYLSEDGLVIFVDKLIPYELPKSGGMGTIPFTMAGLLLMAGAVFMAVLKCKGKTGKM